MDMKRAIADYLKQGAEGPFFYRMVETVLSRDKNWVRWKMENCPSIARPPVSPEVFAEAKRAALKTATSKRLRPTPMGSLDLDFLRPDAPHNQWDSYKNPERYQLPELGSFKRRLADDDFDIEMAKTPHEKQVAMDRKACDTWKALRLARKFKPLSAFEKIDDDDNITALFEDAPKDSKVNGTEEDDEEITVVLPSDTRPIVLAGAGISELTSLLKSRQPGVFRTVVRHTTRRRADGEVNGKHFHFVDKLKFNMMVDGDQMVEFTEADGVSYGTSHSAVRAISEAGRIPILHLDHAVGPFWLGFSCTASSADSLSSGCGICQGYGLLSSIRRSSARERGQPEGEADLNRRRHSRRDRSCCQECRKPCRSSKDGQLLRQGNSLHRRGRSVAGIGAAYLWWRTGGCHGQRWCGIDPSHQRKDTPIGRSRGGSVSEDGM